MKKADFNEENPIYGDRSLPMRARNILNQNSIYSLEMLRQFLKTPPPYCRGLGATTVSLLRRYAGLSVARKRKRCPTCGQLLRNKKV